MWGWKPIERELEVKIPLEDAKKLILEEGFEVHVENPTHMIFKRKGYQIAAGAEKIPLELAIATTGSGLFFQLRYGTFVLFDTGDLNSIAGRLAEKLEAAGAETLQM